MTMLRGDSGDWFDTMKSIERMVIEGIYGYLSLAGNLHTSRTRPELKTESTNDILKGKYGF